jgi:hypothetical protein
VVRQARAVPKTGGPARRADLVVPWVPRAKLDKQSERRALECYEQRRAEARLGLSTAHSSPRDKVSCFASVAVGGSCVRARALGWSQQKAPDWRARGVIREFSRGSRGRLMRSCASIPRWHLQRGILFVTLTYPGTWDGDWQRWKRDLDVFLRRVQRKFPAAGAVWKLEPQQRGAPHYHLLVVGVPFMARDWVSRNWFEVVGSGDAKHLAAGTQVQLARSYRGVLSYAAKYATKGMDALPESWEGGVGRWWGVVGRVRLEVQREVVPLTLQQFHRFRRLLVRVLNARRRSRRGGVAHPFRGMWLMLSDQVAARVLEHLGAI